MVGWFGKLFLGVDDGNLSIWNEKGMLIVRD